ncbi:MAG: hypothetical protein M3Q06_15445 [Bacteroidota bacterium]|nr:hypothetical protein [Bacteroidota bacterium]
MKKLFGMALIAVLGLSAPAFAQDSKVEKGAKKAWKGTKNGAKKAAHKTAEVSSRGAARVADQKSDVWVGPEGQTIYVTGGDRYYWVNGRGKRIYVSESALRARNKD